MNHQKAKLMLMIYEYLKYNGSVIMLDLEDV